MEDENQSTLKKKIQILFQLGKWPDVVKLCDSHMEKYGKDPEIDVIRFKSERHMGVPAPPPKPSAAVPPAAPPPPARAEAPLDLSGLEEAVEIAPSAMEPESPFADESPSGGRQGSKGSDMFGGDSFSENELVITDPFALDEPEINLAPDQPLVSLSGLDHADESEVSHVPALEMEGPADSPADAAAEAPGEEEEIDFRNIGGMAIDAEPELMAPSAPASPAEPFSHPAPAATEESFSQPEPEAPFRPGPVSVDVVEEPKPKRPTPFPADGERETGKPPRPVSPFQAREEDRITPRRRYFSPKLALLIVLPLVAAGALWLALTGKLNFSGAEEPAAGPEPAAQAPVVRRPRPKATVPVAVPPAQVDEQEKAFAEKFAQAEELYKKGDLLKAWAVLLEAKKIRTTEPLRLLEETLANQIRAAEEQTKQQTQVVQSQWEMETQAFEKASAEDTLSGWQNFLKAFPQGEFASRAEKKIALFEKKAAEAADQQLQLRIQQAQKARPRAVYLSLSQADITAMLSQRGRPPAQFEIFERGGVRMLLDYATGLMWTLWNKPMAYDKARWWANRVTAGYGGWRLPTAEEALSLLQADRSHYAGLADFSIWTGDTASDQSRTAWALKIPEGRFSPESYAQACYVWSVRKAGK